MVTCPTRISVALLFLTASTSSAATALTWDGLPGIPSARVEAMVCTESTTTTAGHSAWPRISTASAALVVQEASSKCESRPSLCALDASCPRDSSPETYTALRPAAATLPASWSRSVDLPIPGSPPRRTADPGWRPWPRTRSRSGSPLGAVGVLSCANPEREIGPWEEPREEPRRGGCFAPACCTRVFHSPQPSHWPRQRVLTTPQAEQA